MIAPGFTDCMILSITVPGERGTPSNPEADQPTKLKPASSTAR